MDDPGNEHIDGMGADTDPDAPSHDTPADAGDDSDAPVEMDSGAQPTKVGSMDDDIAAAESNAESEGMPPPEVAQAEQQMSDVATPAQASEPESSPRAAESAPAAESAAAPESTVDDGWEPGGDVRAQNVSISQGGARDVYASTMSLEYGGARDVRADTMTISFGGVGVARTKELNLAERASAFVVSSGSATVHEGGNVFVLLARSVSGEVRPLLDWRAALALGAGFAVVRSLLSGRRRR